MVSDFRQHDGDDASCCFVATTTAALIAAGMAAGGSVTAAKIASNSAKNSAKAQTAANDQTLDFTKQQAENAYQNSESTRRANYDQWKAKQSTIADFAKGYGINAGVPDYAPGIDPRFTGQQPNVPSYAPGGDLTSARAKFDQLFPGETLTPEMVKAKEAELTAAGFTLRPNVQGQVGKIQYGSGPIIDIIQGAGSGLNKKQWLLPTPGPQPGTIGAFAPQQPAFVNTPDPYRIFQRGTIAGAR